MLDARRPACLASCVGDWGTVIYTRKSTWKADALRLLALASVFALAGCGMSNLTSGLGGGLFGESETSAPAQTVSEAQLLNAAQTSDGTQFTGNTGAKGCPQFVIWPRDKHLTVYADGQEGDGLAIVQRGEITKTARECQVSPGRVTIRYGFSGRVLLGPRGTPGTFVLPISVFVTDYKREKVQTQQHAISVVVPDSKPIGYFSKVESVTFDIPQGVRPDDFQLFVGFDRPKGKS